MITYVQINPTSKIVEAVSSLKARVDNEHLIEVADPATANSLLGATYDPESGAFTEPTVEKTKDLRPSIAVSTNPVSVNGRVSLPENTAVSLTIEARGHDGTLLSMNDTFAVPVRRIGGAVERTIGVTFVDGVATKDIIWPSSGEFETTEDLINMHLPPEQHFKFNRLVFSVYE